MGKPNMTQRSQLKSNLERIAQEYQQLRSQVSPEELTPEDLALSVEFEAMLANARSYAEEFPAVDIDELPSKAEIGDMLSAFVGDAAGYPPWEDSEPSDVDTRHLTAELRLTGSQSWPVVSPPFRQKSSRPGLPPPPFFIDPSNRAALLLISQRVSQEVQPRQPTAGILEVVINQTAQGRLSVYAQGDTPGGFGSGQLLTVIVPVVAMALDWVLQRLGVDQIEALQTLPGFSQLQSEAYLPNTSEMEEMLHTAGYLKTGRQARKLVEATRLALAAYFESLLK